MSFSSLKEGSFQLDVMAMVENAPSQRSATQDFKSCCRFLPQSVWDILRGQPPSTPVQRVDAVVGFLVNRLGLRHPTEPTVAFITALCAEGDGQNVMQLQSLCATVKSVVRTATARARIAATPLPGNVYVY